MAAGRALSLGQVRLHNPADHSLDHCFFSTRLGLQILTGGGRRLLRDDLHHRQNHHGGNQGQTSGDPMHAFFSTLLPSCVL